MTSRARHAGHRYCALFRGVNLGGMNTLPMADLRARFVDAGAEDVRSYVQSGNVVFRTTRSARAVCERVAAAVEERFGHRPPVMLRTGAELQAVLDGCPFAGAAEGTVHVTFLADTPRPERARLLDPARSPGDTFVLAGKHVYMHLPNGMARTKLTNAYFETRLETLSTMRNWRTVTALAAMANESMEGP